MGQTLQTFQEFDREKLGWFEEWHPHDAVAVYIDRLPYLSHYDLEELLEHFRYDRILPCPNYYRATSALVNPSSFFLTFEIMLPENVFSKRTKMFRLK